MTLPLEQIRILDLTRLLPGGICTLMLADQGAEVIKIEQPVTGDYARWYVPRVGDYAAVFHAMNRNKRSVAIDLKTDEGRKILYRLAQDADVLIESFRPQVAQKLGLADSDLKRVNPRLVVCSLSGYGQDGPAANLAAHDLNLAGLTGVLAAGNEQVLPIQAMDFGGAYMAAFAITTALFGREQSGRGAYIDAALLDAGISLMTLARAEAFAQGHPPRPSQATLTGGLACYRVYRTADDKPIVLAALEPKFWQTFCALAGREDLAKVSYLDPDEQSHLVTEISDVFSRRTLAEWDIVLGASETCTSSVLDVMQAAQHPQIVAREALYMADGVAHSYTPFKLGARRPHESAPHLGADTIAVLGQVGYGQAQLQTWQAAGVIAQYEKN